MREWLTRMQRLLNGGLSESSIRPTPGTCLNPSVVIYGADSGEVNFEWNDAGPSQTVAKNAFGYTSLVFWTVQYGWVLESVLYFQKRGSLKNHKLDATSEVPNGFLTLMYDKVPTELNRRLFAPKQEDL